jgi:cytochrome c5
MTRIHPADLLSAILLAVGIASCLLVHPTQAAESRSAGPLDDAVAQELKRGGEVAKTACATCHVYPAPDLLDQASWALEILPKMRQMMGFESINYERMLGGKLVETQRPYPKQPLLNEDDWLAVVRYYLATAPVRLPNPASPTPGTIRPDFRTTSSPEFKDAEAVITAVRIDAKEHHLYVADSTAKALFILNAQGKTLAATGLEKPAVHLNPTENGIYITVIGRLYPSDEPEGQVLFIGKPGAEGARTKVLLDKLHRPVHTLVTDINQDGRADLVVCSYGNILGRFSWFENKGQDSYEEHVLIDRPGAIASESVDLDQDGKQDLVVLMAQAWEGVYWLRNTGSGFETIPLVQWPPSWGSTSFQLVDFNGDRHLDLLASNGDNGDFGQMPAPMKPYHGVRVYLNNGKQQFTEQYFYPMNGAYKALAGDFQGKGRLDIAAIAFFPDFSRSPWESMVYLEHIGNQKWRPTDLPDSRQGRWFVLDAGDLDGDGHPDLAAGAFLKGPGRVLKTDMERWRTRPTPVLWWLGRTQKEAK